MEPPPRRVGRCQGLGPGPPLEAPQQEGEARVQMGAAEIGGILTHACCPGDTRTSAPGSEPKAACAPASRHGTAGDPLLKLRSKRGGHPELPSTQGQCVRGWSAREELVELGFGIEVSREAPAPVTAHAISLLPVYYGSLRSFTTNRQTFPMFSLQRDSVGH